jgi:hypothetical protein
MRIMALITIRELIVPWQVKIFPRFATICPIAESVETTLHLETLFAQGTFILPCLPNFPKRSLS